MPVQDMQGPARFGRCTDQTAMCTSSPMPRPAPVTTTVFPVILPPAMVRAPPLLRPLAARCLLGRDAKGAAPRCSCPVSDALHD
jgi:hypothetical protein